MNIKLTDAIKPYSEKWFPAIRVRHSSRTYDESRPVPPDIFAGLQTFCTTFHPLPGVRLVLLTESVDKIFTGFLGSYGKIKGATIAAAFIGDTGEPEMQAAAGYVGEAFVLEATALGLGTCWVAGTYKRKNVESLLKIKDTERVLSVTPIGYPVAKTPLDEKMMGASVRHTTRKPLEALVAQNDIARPDWIKIALESARQAPSASNRQPWIFTVQRNSITIGVRTKEPDFIVSKRLDCGIAMLHLEVAALSQGVTGSWEFLKAPQVARFTFASR